jgi:WD40 repeat protein
MPVSEHFVAHGSNVNCLALGHKSGRVLVTGGDDKKVNLWAVGKHNCIMVCYFPWLYYSIVNVTD